MIRFLCPTCQKRLKAPDDGVGRKTHCPRCGQRLFVPSSAQAQGQNKPIMGQTAPSVPDWMNEVRNTEGMPLPVPQQLSGYVLFECPTCQSPLDVAESEIGHMVACPKCGTSFAALRNETISDKHSTINSSDNAGGIEPIVHLVPRGTGLSRLVIFMASIRPVVFAYLAVLFPIPVWLMNELELRDQRINAHSLDWYAMEDLYRKERLRPAQEMIWQVEARNADWDNTVGRELWRESKESGMRGASISEVVGGILLYAALVTDVAAWLVSVAMSLYLWRKHNVFGWLCLVLFALMMLRMGYILLETSRLKERCEEMHERYGEMHRLDVERYMKHPPIKRPWEK